MINWIIILFSVLNGSLFIVFNAKDSFLTYLFGFLVLIGSYLGLILLYFIILYFISLTINVKKEYKKKNAFYQFMFDETLNIMLIFSRVKIKVKGLEIVPTNKRFMLIGNHRSNYDPICQLHVLRGKKYNLIQISKPENFRIPIAGPMMKRCLHFPIDRDNNRNALKTILMASNYLENNEYSIGVFPEGTRNKVSKEMLSFKSGTFKICMRAKAPLVICTLKNTELIHKRVPFRRTKVELNFIKCMYYEDYKDMTSQELADYARTIMEKDLEEDGK